MTIVKVLFLEDEAKSVEGIIEYLNDHQDMYHVDLGEFQEYEEILERFRPDIIVLDLLAGTQSPEVPGVDIFDNTIWPRLFCPVVVYSAQPDLFTEERDPHPLVKTIHKGRDSEGLVIQAINELKPHGVALQKIRNRFPKDFHVALREVAPYTFQACEEEPDPGKRIGQIFRAVLRRLAAMIVELAADDEDPLACWEQYICPPLGNDLQLGDVLLSKGQTNSDPASFRIVLTPSCDLATGPEREGKPRRKPKVNCVLLARCIPITEGIKLTKLNLVKKKNLEENLGKWMLSQGYLESILPIPALPGRIPHMAAKLRDLELVPLDGIDDKFEVVASIDSPFRELVSWAYMQTGARLGLPDRNFAQWSKEIMSSLAEGQ
ncbi:MAG: hypothetical protein HY914_22070 [Desulfomonile tiedjei]|nr:hypothetical protein [Desulfomonile tiedjei]